MMDLPDLRPPWRIQFDEARYPYDARNALGLIAGPSVSYQPLDGDLTSLAAASATNAIYYRSAANTWSPVTIGGNLSFAGGTLDVAASPVLTGNPQAPTPTAGDNDTSIATTAFVTSALAAAVTVLPNYLGGLTLANNAVTPTTVLDIAAGAATSDDNTTLMVQPAAMSKNCNAAWAVGNGAGALDVGTTMTTNVWLYVFLIKRTDTGVVDVLLSQSLTSPTLPSPYSKKRRIGCIKTGAGPVVFGFIQTGDEFAWKIMIYDINASNVSTSDLAVVLPVPLGLAPIANMLIVNASSAGYFMVRTPTTQDSTMTVAAAAASGFTSGQYRMKTDTSSQIMVKGSAAMTGALFIACYGWVDTRGK
jgi:hypothetical protein